MSSDVLKIGVLAVLLVSGIGYLSSMRDTGSADPVDMLSPETDVSTLDSLRLFLEEHTLPNWLGTLAKP